ncbi:MAG TPA: B12-binding domain-containing radical SAM protein [Deltaproteobacteria bacterium]|nr:MAG: B12-binding domain-containing radical SAM protein [Deltaproteobacteria bacterium GWA2_55_82]OGQ63130.1 MAG: B12-binding domain-containing radical SAM protein [Deltaproteobacteria bacterium RIFCSPLOWO2_02_FULL_55_12]OIJ73595.1 MAG: B12-binding domain-containing radical SAM protein [Deltaproteobacteria bacterium GWC2_55_46]HBG47730.1 B12-binding domain-containing radical SAM protein [Deltaproteobacteria bacterium]HCY12048.1 B12-binding domain-containing radical SAM protein [Deltaproteobac
MKVAISYPPLESAKGVPLLSQNRQFQWFNNPTYIYPVVPAYAATLLQKEGFDVFWDDAIAQGLQFEAWLSRIKKERPDVIVIETKTPVVKRHWAIIDRLKDEAERSSWDLLVALVGDHVTALPEESLANSRVDFVLTGGDHDFLLLCLCKALASGGAYDGLEPGIWYRKDGKAVKSEGRHEKHDLESLPFIDRDLTQWGLYSSRNGNFKRRPGTYTMAGRDCWWGKCSFCSWTTLYPGKDFRSVSPERLLDEIGVLIEKYGVREVFDDSGSFPACDWLETFCKGMIKRGYHKKIYMGCNMRINALGKSEYELMAKAGFRFVLFGLESVNQATLDRLNKGLKVEQIVKGFRLAKAAGLEPHVTAMIGYPWEGKADAGETISFAKEMFRKGYIDTLQATIVVPYPGTPMYEEARREGWLLTEDWDRYDMRESVWRSPISEDDVKKLTKGLYKAALNPLFITRKVLKIRSVDDLRFLFMAGMKLMGHLSDFSARAKGNAAGREAS